ncbi:MOSC N-terminal beta barrel domain-containing protein [Paenarthrobacter sp. CCNWLY172]|uniref:MOSC domain-containing protein n=1 Tax=Micrococcaceae TaxID=1268 RepID=UPI001A988C15|nr:MOSC N-terminal beta barrel domain-containing protein [Arthrobacter sp. D5-1]QSZ50211.1 hypothetical protein AYX22_18590 [Arthrobacter sp. D5-1]
MTHEGTLVGTVRSLYRYPIKSTAGEALRIARVTAGGLQHDRKWAVYTDDGGIASGKRTRRFRPVLGLMQWSSRIEDGHDIPILVSPEGIQYHADDPAAPQALSEVLGQQLRLRRETTIKHHDETPLHLVTTSSLAAIAVLSGQPVDERRFRANIIIDTGTEPVFQEDNWIGAELVIGDQVRVRLGQGMPRCLMIDQSQRGVAVEQKILKLLGTHHNTNLGLQAHTSRPGKVRIGDRVILRRPEVPAASTSLAQGTYKVRTSC